MSRLNILQYDPGTVKTVPKKRLEALLNATYRERLLSLAQSPWGNRSAPGSS